MGNLGQILKARGWVIACFLLLGVSTFAADEEGIVIYSGKSQVREGWNFSAWGKGIATQLSTEHGRDAKTGFAGSVLDTSAEAYGGVSFHVAWGQDKQALSIPLTDDLKKDGVIEIYLNCGKGLAGGASGDAKVQVDVTFTRNDGKADDMATSTDPFDPLDGDPNTWELIRIPLAPLIAKLETPGAVAGLSGVNVQYSGDPTCEILIGDCHLKAK